MSTSVVRIDPAASDTSLSGAQANAVANAIVEAANRNADNQFIFDSACRDYNAQMQAGALTPPTPPKAPAKWVVEPANGPSGFAAAVPSTSETLPFNFPLQTFNAADPAPTFPPNTIAIGHQIGSTAFYTALDNDTVPAGKTVPGPDGHMYQKWDSPFRKQGLYEQVS